MSELSIIHGGMKMLYKNAPYQVRMTNGRNLSFTGQLLAVAVINQHNEKQELALYGTRSGHFVAERITRTTRPGAMGTCEGKVCMNPAEVKAFLGYHPAAREMYIKVGFL